MRTPMVAVVFALAVSFVGAGNCSATARATTQAIDFSGFLKISNEVFEVREDRLLPLDEFLALAEEPEVLLLDTRSESAFAAKHLAGATHLSLSDLTEESLSRVVGARERTVLIYCNNNFVDDEPPFMTKRPTAALNIPTFVSLWAYGYKNVYELGDLLDQSDPRLAFEGFMVDGEFEVAGGHRR